MPNFCENDLTVEGPKDVVLQFLKFAAGESPFDFNRFVPYPEEFKRLDDAAEAWDKEHAGTPLPERPARPKDGFDSGGYEWLLANWGTNRPTPDVKVDGPVTGQDGTTLKLAFRFTTLRSAPKPVIAKAAKLYPALRFELQYFECVCEFEGLFCCSGGDVEADEDDH